MTKHLTLKEKIGYSVSAKIEHRIKEILVNNKDYNNFMGFVNIH